MARDHGRVNVGIWTDPEWRRLPPAAQHLYLLLWTSPALTYCGTHDWRPGRLAALSYGFTAAHMQMVADCLTARHFLVVDQKTEEILVRSWARWDGLMKQPRMAVSFALAYAAVASETIRQVLVHELRKIRNELPDLACWNDTRVTEVLCHPAVSAKDLPVPDDPFGDAVGGGFGDTFALGLPQTQPKVWGKVWVPPTPAPAPAPKPPVVEGGVGGDDNSPRRAARKRASALSDDFAPNDTNRRIAQKLGVDLAAVLPQFLDYHAAKGSAFVDWHRALNTWIRRERPEPVAKPAARLPHARDLETPPDDLEGQALSEWYRERAERRRAR